MKSNLRKISKYLAKAGFRKEADMLDALSNNNSSNRSPNGSFPDRDDEDPEELLDEDPAELSEDPGFRAFLDTVSGKSSNKNNNNSNNIINETEMEELDQDQDDDADSEDT
jgi:hypothetical protein